MSRELSHSERALGALRKLIVTGALAPGEAISDQHLATQLGMSRTPVREALRQLADEELVVIWPRAATRIAPVDPEALPGIYGLLASLLSVAISRSIPELRAACASELRKLRVGGGLDHHYRLAWTLVEESRFGMLERAMTAPAWHARRAEELLGADLPAKVRRPPQFVALRDACAARDAHTAAALMAETLSLRGELVRTAWETRA